MIYFTSRARRIRLRRCNDIDKALVSNDSAGYDEHPKDNRFDHLTDPMSPAESPVAALFKHLKNTHRGIPWRIAMNRGHASSANPSKRQVPAAIFQWIRMDWDERYIIYPHSALRIVSLILARLRPLPIENQWWYRTYSLFPVSIRDGAVSGREERGQAGPDWLEINKSLKK